MKRLSAACAFLVAALLTCVPLPTSINHDGLYNTFSGLIWCANETACLHEIGHALDACGGWTSHGEAWTVALQALTLAELQRGDPEGWAGRVLSTPGVLRWAGYGLDAQSEIYAALFAAADGRADHLPGRLRMFYDWQLAEQMRARIKKTGATVYEQYLSGKCR